MLVELAGEVAAQFEEEFVVAAVFFRDGLRVVDGDGGRAFLGIKAKDVGKGGRFDLVGDRGFFGLGEQLGLLLRLDGFGAGQRSLGLGFGFAFDGDFTGLVEAECDRFGGLGAGEDAAAQGFLGAGFGGRAGRIGRLRSGVNLARRSEQRRG